MNAEQTLTREQADYLAALQRFDWRFRTRPVRGNGAYLAKCRAELERLQALQISIDPTGSLWNSVAPKGWELP